MRVSRTVPVSGTGAGVIRVHNTHITRGNAEAGKFRRDQFVEVRNVTDPTRFYVGPIAGAGRGIDGLTMDAVGLDYNQAQCLGIKNQHEAVELEIKPASIHTLHQWMFGHSNLMLRNLYRFMLALAVLGAMNFVGLIALVLLQ